MYTIRPTLSRIFTAACIGGLLLQGCGANDSGQSAGETSPGASPTTRAPTGERSPVASTYQERDVISENMPYAEVGDELVYGYFVAPADMFEPLPAVIMIHEWWGLNDNIREQADRLAAAGYIVFAVDLFGGKTATTPSAARELMLGVVEDPDSANENLLSAYRFVSETAGAPAVAALGWRFGGIWSMNAAMLLPDELDAVVIYYGQVGADEEKLLPVNVPILGLFAADDISVKKASVEAFRDALERLRKDYEIQIYEGVRQGFANEDATNFDRNAAADAWQRSLNFLQRHLVGGSAATEMS
jgi:carboxymethylenebutenolidase